MAAKEAHSPIKMIDNGVHSQLQTINKINLIFGFTCLTSILFTINFLTFLKYHHSYFRLDLNH